MQYINTISFCSIIINAYCQTINESLKTNFADFLN